MERVYGTVQCSTVQCSTEQCAYGRELINRCQRVVMYTCLSVCRTVSTEAIQVYMGGLP